MGGSGNNLGGNLTFTEDNVTIFSQGETYTVQVPGMGERGINPADDDTYHIYSDAHVLGPTSHFNGPGVLWQNVMEDSAPNNMLGGWVNGGNSIPHEQGSTTNITGMMQFGDLLKGETYGTVSHFFNSSDMTIVNVTEANHQLYPGMVTRTLEEIDGNYVLVTYGVGNGILPGPNDWLSDLVWGSNANRIARETIFEEANGLRLADPRTVQECFPSDTLISLQNHGVKTITEIEVGDIVLAFDSTANFGRGALVPRKVTALYHNTTDEWIKLTWTEGGEAKELVTTPGHHFLDRFGNFPTIEEMLKDGMTSVVLASGDLVEVHAERIIYSEETAYRFEQAYQQAAAIGNTALKPKPVNAWQTYNFEVEDLHTYVAGGVRVHNESGFLGRVGNGIDNSLDSFFGGYDGDGSIRDTITDALTMPFHMVGKVAVTAANAISEGLSAISDNVSTGLTKFGTAVTNTWNGVKTTASDAWNNTKDSVSNAWNDTKDTVSQTWDKVKETASNAWEKTKDFFSGASPVILDLDQDGVEVNADAKVSFDWDNDGFLEQSSWVGADDGFLVVDLEADGSIGTDGGDGIIDQGRELAFAQWSLGEDMTDLQALAEARDADGNLVFDTNGDGVLDANDAIWGSMKVFQDLNQNGRVDEGELKTLNEWDISQINLAYDDGSSFSESDDDISVLGNTLHGLASYVRDGQVVEGGVGDISLLFANAGWRTVTTATGYYIEFEGGETQSFWDANGQDATDVNLANGGFVGAFGDDRDNVLDASNSTIDVVISGGGGADQVLGGSGDDLLSGGLGADIISGGAGDDVLLADSFDNISGGAVTGGEGYDKLIVSQETTLNIADLGALSIESVVAGDGNDTVTSLSDDQGFAISGNGGADTLTTAGGNDILSGGTDDDVLTAGAGKDRLFGGSGADTLNGGDDADFLSGGTGDDLVQGGGGDDRYFYQRGDGHDRFHDYAEGEILTLTDTQAEYHYSERVKVQSGKSSKYVNELRTGFVETTTLESSFGQIDGGIDTLEFGFGITIEDVLFSVVDGDAVVQFRNRDDAATDADERDTVSADDSITVQDWTNQQSRIENFAFADGITIDMSQIMQGQTGHADEDTLVGAEEGDWINSGGGNDTIVGNGGNDVLIAGSGDDLVDGGEGRDFIFGGEGDDSIEGGAGNDYLIGGAGNDTLSGGAGDDALSGDDGDDNLYGGAGNDILIGGTGDDFLNGGLGDDTYFFFRGDGLDRIHDYAEEARDAQEATGEMTYQRSGKSGKYVQEMRTVQKMFQMDGGWDAVQFGYSVLLSDVFFELQGEDLMMGIRQFDEDGIAVQLADMEDVVTVQDWTNEMSRVEEVRFGNGLSIDISEFETFQSGYGDDDAFVGSASSDLLSGGDGADDLSGEAGNDVLVGGDGDDHLKGGAGDDDLYGGAGDDILDGGDGDDYLIAGAGDDELNGGAGDDVLIGGLGDDILRGGLGDDTYIFNRGDGHDTIDESVFEIEDGGSTTTEYGAGDISEELQEFTETTGGFKFPMTETYQENVWVSESRTGASITAIDGGDDVLQFGNYIDISDLIVTTTGVGGTSDLVVELDPIVAGDVVDDSITITNWGTSDFRVETFRFANDFVLDVSSVGYAATGDDADNTMSAIDAPLQDGDGVWLAGGVGADTLTGSANDDILMGGAGADRIEGGDGDDVYVFGLGDGRDTIFDTDSSTVGSDTSNPGGDKLLFGAGITIEDLILERDGDNMRIYVGDANNMSVPLAEMTDAITIEGWNNSDNRLELLQFFNGLDFDISDIDNTSLGADLSGPGSEAPINDLLDGTEQSDWMDGFAGDDTLNGLGADDFIFGRAGDDIINGGHGDDIMAGGDGDDTLDGGYGSDVMTGGVGDDTLNGGHGNDVMMGGTGDDTLDGGLGNDLIVGDRGNDTIIASSGTDQIRFGYGDGNDTYQGNASYADDDVFVFEEGIEADDIWFGRLDNSLVVRIHGAEDTVLFQEWFDGPNTNVHVNGFFANGEWLDHNRVDGLVDAMSPHIADMNDGTTAYGILVGETPESIQTAIDSAWT